MRTQNRHPARMLAAVVLAAVALLPGCDDPFIDPYVNEGRYFTIWGFVDATRTEQVVRVIPVTRTASGDRAPTVEDLDATVVSIEVASGVATSWQPTVVEYADGSWGHVFRTNARFRAGYHYRLEVRRSDGKVASADTWVPVDEPLGAVTREAPRQDPDGRWRQRIVLNGVDSPWDLRFTYLVQNPVARLVHEVPYDRAGERTGDGSWVVDLDLTGDQVAVREHVREAIRRGEIPGEGGFSTPFNLHQMGVRLVLPDAEWDLPAGPIDPERFALPTAHTNVTNGYGYWGSVNRLDVKWLVTNELSVALGWDY